MSKLKRMMLETAMMLSAAASENNIYMDKTTGGGMRFNPDYKPNRQHREMREFTIKGKKVMAYSRKDAITRLKHSK